MCQQRRVTLEGIQQALELIQYTIRTNYHWIHVHVHSICISSTSPCAITKNDSYHHLAGRRDRFISSYLQLYPWVSRFSPQSAGRQLLVSVAPLHPGWHQWCLKSDPYFGLVHVRQGFGHWEQLPFPIHWGKKGRITLSDCCQLLYQIWKIIQSWLYV